MISSSILDKHIINLGLPLELMATIYKINTVLNSGKGNQWYGYNITKVGPVNDPAMYERAKQFYQSLANK